MASSDFAHSSDDSSGSDESDWSSAFPNSLSQLDDNYATDPDSAVDGTPQKTIDEEDGQSNESEFHTPTQLSKRRRLPSVSPPKRREVVVAESDSESLIRMSAILCLIPRLPASAASGVRGSRGHSW